MKLSRRLVVVAALLAVPGCIAASESHDGPIGEGRQGATLDPPPTGNGENPNCYNIFQNRQALRDFATHPLHAIPASLSFTTECRDQIIGNAVHCALRQTESATDGKVEHDGWEGLAPGWMNDPLTVEGQRWVTGCMIQRLNATGQHVPILPEGNTPPIYKVPALESDYPINESNAWGNYFDPYTITSYDGYVCYEPSVKAACDTHAFVEDWFNSRYCDGAGDAGASNPCHLKLMGPCIEKCMTFTTGYAACKKPDDSYDDHTVHVRLQEPPVCVAPK